MMLVCVEEIRRERGSFVCQGSVSVAAFVQEYCRTGLVLKRDGQGQWRNHVGEKLARFFMRIPMIVHVHTFGDVCMCVYATPQQDKNVNTPHLKYSASVYFYFFRYVQWEHFKDWVNMCLEQNCCLRMAVVTVIEMWMITSGVVWFPDEMLDVNINAVPRMLGWLMHGLGAKSLKGGFFNLCTIKQRISS